MSFSHRDLEGPLIIYINNDEEIDVVIRYICEETIEKKSNHLIGDIFRLREILYLVKRPYTIIIERNYVDKVFRDSYYSHISSKHFDNLRNTIRMSIFLGNDINLSDFMSGEGQSKLQQIFVGSIVLRPLSLGLIGRSYLDPMNLTISKCYLRTTLFEVMVFGVKLKINAYPFSSQDSETMTCAETTIWSLLEYYGTRYPEYCTVLPSSMVKALENVSNERVLPSRGLYQNQISQLLKNFGFYPIVYNASIFDNFERIFHYYVESGIPICATLEDQGDENRAGHAIVCIGHGEMNIDRLNSFKDERFIIDTSELYNEYIVIDDNGIPYEKRSYENIVNYYDLPKITGIVVPLYKRIYLDANSAQDIAKTIVSNNQIGIHPFLDRVGYSLINEDKEKRDIDLNKDGNITLRLFLTSSRSYKNFKAQSIDSEYMKYIYSSLPMPKFIWVAELSSPDLFVNGMIFGEVVLDATSLGNNIFDSIVIIRYPGHLGYRFPSESQYAIFDRIEYYLPDERKIYSLYRNNLIEVS